MPTKNQSYINQVRDLAGAGVGDVYPSDKRSEDQYYTNQSTNNVKGKTTMPDYPTYNMSPGPVNMGYQNANLGRYHPPMMNG